MTFDEISEQAAQLSYRDKLRLAQLLLQKARKEEEERNPARREGSESPTPLDAELVQYVAERLKKLKPSRKDAVLDSIGAMFQFRGGISEEVKEKMFAALVTARHLSLTENGRVGYPE